MIRLLIADDHAIVRSGLAQIFALVSDIEVAGEACDGTETMDLLRKESFDLLLLDLNMPGISGADLISRVKLHHPALPILVLSMHNKPQVAAQVLKAGADGYITKDCEPSVLLTAIRKVAARGNYLDPQIAAVMVFDAASTAQRPLHSFLSDRELDVLRMLTQGLGVKEIGVQLAISSKTVSTYKTRLMGKLNLSNMADLMRYAMAHDLLG
ncbi:MAG: DNA-binding response regulator [Comamonadaceae bacterium CG2_30_59_20]|nr:MAG: DNA-binding response regulator [Comamonadaceae bacterium CG2_30_59_20]